MNDEGWNQISLGYLVAISTADTISLKLNEDQLSLAQINPSTFRQF